MPAGGYSFSQLQADLARDIDVYLGYAFEYRIARMDWKRRLGALLMPSLLACLLYRLSHWLHRRGWRRAGTGMALLNLLLTRVSINPASRIGGGFYIAHPSTAIVFQGHAGCDLKLFAGCAVSQAPFTPLHGDHMPNAPQLGDNVSLGSKAFVVGPVRVGSGARIGFNAYVTVDVPAGAVIFPSHLRNHIRTSATAGLNVTVVD